MTLKDWNIPNDALLCKDDVIVKIRYRKQANRCTVTLQADNTLHVQLHEPLTAIAYRTGSRFLSGRRGVGGELSNRKRKLIKQPSHKSPMSRTFQHLLCERRVKTERSLDSEYQLELQYRKNKAYFWVFPKVCVLLISNKNEYVMIRQSLPTWGLRSSSGNPASKGGAHHPGWIWVVWGEHPYRGSLFPWQGRPCGQCAWQRHHLWPLLSYGQWRVYHCRDAKSLAQPF